MPLDFFMGIPILSVRIRGIDHRMFFDTGAQVSYFQDASLAEFPLADMFDDFYPGLGRFQTQTFNVDMELGPQHLVLRCGTLPEGLSATLMMADTQGIIGNQLLVDRVVGHFPRRRVLVLGCGGTDGADIVHP